MMPTSQEDCRCRFCFVRVCFGRLADARCIGCGAASSCREDATTRRFDRIARSLGGNWGGVAAISLFLRSLTRSVCSALCLIFFLLRTLEQVVLLGDTHAGKTSLVLRFVEGHYKENRNATVGAFFLTKRLTLESMTCKLLIWDTAGQEQFQKLAVTYYKQAAAAIICYDVSGNAQDQISKLQTWLEQVEQNISNQSDHRIVLCVAACKSDLAATPGIEDEARRVAQQYGALYIKTSAKNDTNVSEVFTKTAESVLQAQHEYATGRGGVGSRPIPVTMGAGSMSLRERSQRRSLSPAANHDRKTFNAGAAASSAGGANAPGGTGAAAGSLSPNKSQQFNQQQSQQLNARAADAANNNTDSSTAGESDDNLEDGPAEASAPRIMCDNGILVCGEGSGSECCIL